LLNDIRVIYGLGFAFITIVATITKQWVKVNHLKIEQDKIEDCIGDFKKEIRTDLKSLNQVVYKLVGEIKRMNGGQK